MLLAERAVFLKRKLFLHLLLVPLRIGRNASALRTLHFRHIVLDLSHNRTKKYNVLTLRKNPNSVNIPLLELLTGIEPVTSSLPRTCSTN